jgi:beta-glucosidase
MIPARDSDIPATHSKTILTGKLRQELGFEGLIVTDALIMGGITKYAPPAEIAVMAVAAGVDILLMPRDPEVAIEAIYQAVRSGKLSESLIHQSLKRIWQAKQKLLPNSPNLNQLAQPEATVTVNSILRDSLQIGSNLPLKPQTEQNLRNLIVVDDLLNCSFLDIQTPAVAIPQKFGYQRQIIDQNSLVSAQSDSRSTLLQVFIRGNPFRGTAGLTKVAQEFYQQLLRSGQIEGLVIYGSPYVKDWFVAQLATELPWIFSYGQMNLAQGMALKVLFGLSATETSSLNNQSNFGF